MFRQLSFLIISFVVVLAVFAGHIFAATRLEPMTVAYSNFTGTYGPLWLAVEEASA